MAKMGNTKCATARWSDLSAKAIIAKLKAAKEIKNSCRYRCHYAEIFSGGKRTLGLADCLARDFSAQISHVSLVLIKYNLLASMKGTFDYETIGGLFGDVYMGVHELTVEEKSGRL